MRRRCTPIVLAAIALFALPGGAAAGYLTPAYESKLEGWLGEGNLNFTLLFEKTAGDGKTSFDFHAAVDGQGRTFTLIKVSQAYNYYTGQWEAGGDIIGGYNPQSWSTSTNYNYTLTDAERTAFLFNLTDDRLLRQKLNSDPDGSGYGAYQTFNYNLYGPTFGGGHDLNVGYDYLGGTGYSLEGGYANNYSYGAGFGNNVFGGQYHYFTITGFEVYTLSDGVNPTPAPPGLVLAAVGAVLVLGRAQFLRRVRTATA